MQELNQTQTANIVGPVCRCHYISRTSCQTVNRAKICGLHEKTIKLTWESRHIPQRARCSEIKIAIAGSKFTLVIKMNIAIGFCLITYYSKVLCHFFLLQCLLYYYSSWTYVQLNNIAQTVVYWDLNLHRDFM